MAISRKRYKKGDKIMLLESGQILTVYADLSNHQEPGIIVQEKIGRMVMSSEVRPAGRTREWLEAGKGITEPEPNSVPPPQSIFPLPTKKS